MSEVKSFNDMALSPDWIGLTGSNSERTKGHLRGFVTFSKTKKKKDSLFHSSSFSERGKSALQASVHHMTLHY